MKQLGLRTLKRRRVKEQHQNCEFRFSFFEFRFSTVYFRFSDFQLPITKLLGGQRSAR
jgi:hypothetical protein